MFKRWWNHHIRYPDPGYQSIFYASRIVVIVLVVTGVLYSIGLKEFMSGTMAAFFMGLSHLGIGFKARFKRLAFTGVLCALGIFIGSLVGSTYWLFGIVMFACVFAAYQFADRGPPVLMMLIMPIFSLIISGVYPVTEFSVAVDRLVVACYGALFCLVVCAVYFPYRSKKMLCRTEESIKYFLTRFLNLAFLSFLSGHFRMQQILDTRDQLTKLTSLMNQHLVYLRDSELDQGCRAYFNLFAQSYFLIRLFYEPKTPDNWLYLENEIERFRQLLVELMIAWQKGQIEKPLCSLRHELEVASFKEDEPKAMLRAIEKIADAVEVLS